MAYETTDLIKKAIAAIEQRNLVFIEEIVSYLPCCKQTFYDHKLDESDDIKALLEKNKVEIKTNLRDKWYKSDNATLQIALMRLVCTDTERRKLAMNYTELTGRDGDPIIPITNILIERTKIPSSHKKLTLGAEKENSV